MRATLVIAPTVLLAGVLLAATSREVHRGLAYQERPQDAEAQSLDLYLPDAESPPLVVFVESRFWKRMPEKWAIEARFARPLQSHGAAVAIVRQRSAPDDRHPAQAEDVAAALAYLVRSAPRYGYDPKRITLVGHSSGAQLAALVALDPRYLEAHGLEPSLLDGVVGLSGIYDLDGGDGVSAEERRVYEETFGGARARRSASPVRLARSDAPRFLLIAAQNDIPGYAEAAVGFEEALRKRGHRSVRSFRVLQRDHASIFDLGEADVGVGLYVLNFIGLRDLPVQLAVLEASDEYWRSPRFSTEPFWKRGAPVRAHPADERFLEESRRLFQGSRKKRSEWSPARFHAVDLFEYLDALGGEAGSGPWLTLTNVQMEKSYLHLDEIRPFRPVVVVGVDDQHNLFTVTDLHWAEREYSWREDRPRPAPSARPMGAFLYFLEPPGKSLLPPSLGHFSLVEKSFARSEEDPLAALRDLEPDLIEVMTVGNGCIHCHRFREVGTNAGHLRAVDAEFQGGFALPLEKYPPEVWKRFIFQQEDAAEIIGTTPNRVPEPAATRLYELVERERGR